VAALPPASKASNGPALRSRAAARQTKQKLVFCAGPSKLASGAA